MSLSERIKDVEAKILIVDIERLPGSVPIFDQRTSGFIPVYKWTTLPSMLCFSARWYGKRNGEFHAAWDDNYQAMVKRSWELYDEADIVIGYNTVKFDNRHLRGAWLREGLSPPSPWKDVDLYKYGAQFGFESRSLAHLCRMLDLPGKTGHYDVEEAFACMEGDKAARRRMQVYNRGDINATEDVYRHLLPWVSNHPHVAATASNDELRCNRCGSADLNRTGEYTAIQRRYSQYRCANCGGYVRAAFTRRTANTVGTKS